MSTKLGAIQKLFDSVHTPEVKDSVIECQTWYTNHCLYLENSAREHFVQAYWAASNHNMLLEAGRCGAASPEEIKLNWSKLADAGDAIAKAVALPGLTQIEKDKLMGHESILKK